MVTKKIKDICRACGKCNSNPERHWEEFPSDCVLSARIFLKREKDMESVRKAKEELLNLRVEHLRNGTNYITPRERQILKLIEKYMVYGAKDW